MSKYVNLSYQIWIAHRTINQHDCVSTNIKKQHCKSHQNETDLIIHKESYAQHGNAVMDCTRDQELPQLCVAAVCGF